MLAQLSFFSRPSQAQDTARAQSLYNEGAVLAQRGDDRGACEKFEEARALVQTSATQEAVANCHEKLGKLATASSDFDRLAVLFAQRGKESSAVTARERAASLKTRAAQLVIRLAEADRGRAEVLLDGRVLAEAGLGAAVPVDAGPHTLRVTAAARIARDEAFQIVDGEHRELTLDELARAPDPSTAPEPPMAAEAPTPPPAVEPLPALERSRLPVYVALGGAATGALVGSAAGLFAWRQQASARQKCPADVCLNRTGIEENQRARAAYPVAIAGGAVAMVGLGVAAILWWRARSGNGGSRAGIYVAPVLTGERAGLGLVGCF